MPIPSEREMPKGPRWSHFQHPSLHTSGETFRVVTSLQLGQHIQVCIIGRKSRFECGVHEFPYTGAEIHPSLLDTKNSLSGPKTLPMASSTVVQ